MDRPRDAQGATLAACDEDFQLAQKRDSWHQDHRDFSEVKAHHFDAPGSGRVRSVPGVRDSEIHSAVCVDRWLLPGEAHLSAGFRSRRGHEGCVGARDGCGLDLEQPNVPHGRPTDPGTGPGGRLRSCM
ncbi:hypothetical protein SBD_0611 [Streptomyces bottropensis ATCC 25435]|uniref:Uncharacterized protein n=1 Tax=Streptomyces bottropensis ATCC 25435 TaxID=1054862 RepID=M3F8G0_9ACTN|nr:hypothetical protein SBD_0611 [Streptomyces bottropensis ATCC 25435]